MLSPYTSVWLTSWQHITSSLNTWCILSTHYDAVLRTSTPRIRNYSESDGRSGTNGNFTLLPSPNAHSYGARYDRKYIHNYRVPDHCTVPNTQLNVQICLRNQVISRLQPLCAVDHPDISILNAKHIFSVNANNAYVTLTFLLHLTSL
jgi:hypothetical protein